MDVSGRSCEDVGVEGSLGELAEEALAAELNLLETEMREETEDCGDGGGGS